MIKAANHSILIMFYLAGSSGIGFSVASAAVPFAPLSVPAAAPARFWLLKLALTRDFAAPKAEPIFWLAEMKLWELEIDDQTEAVLLLAAVMASPVFL